MDEIMLGQEGRDKVTGFSGIAIGRCSYLTGCDQILLTPKVGPDNKSQDAHWFDVGRVEVTGDGIDPESVRGERSGGPQWDAPEAR